jgi:hypothetical protein
VTPTSPTEVVIEICGEGKTDVAKRDAAPVSPNAGVVTVLTRRLCDDPPTLRVKRSPLMFLQGKGMWQKVKFAKRIARTGGSAGCVFVLDSEGDQPKIRADLERGRNSEFPDFPMAIGVAHPCIEAWLLSDSSAIRQGLGLSGPRPTVPLQPESLPAPQTNRTNNPKTALAACNTNNREPNAAEKTRIAEHLTLSTAETVCPSFRAFADDVRQRIRLPLFSPPPPANDDGPDGDADDLEGQTA